ncbi:MAG: TIGR01906 family membrane protein [Erysipelotrichaceae bacterium]
MSKLNKLLACLFSFCLIIATLLTIVDYNCFDRKFYSAQQAKHEIAEDIGVTQDELDKITDVLLGYLQHENDDMFVEADVNGKTREIFNQREKDHMVDVRNLYERAIMVRNICAVVSLITLIYLIFNKSFNIISNSYNKSLVFFGMIFLFIGLFCLIDFNMFWTYFHEVFFPMNDLWLLDPRTDILINIVPEEFFFALVTRIIIFVVIAVIIYYFLFKYLRRKINA